MPTFVLDWRDL